MKSIDQMTNAELLDEARRRTERRRAGLPVSPGVYRLDGRDIPCEIEEIERQCEYCKCDMSMLDEVCPRCGREPLEDDEQDDVCRLYRAYGCIVYVTSQKRRSKVSEGIPDLFVFAPDRVDNVPAIVCAWWHETKRTRTRQMSPAQIDFRRQCEQTGMVHCVGGLAAAREMLVRVGRARWADAFGGDIESTL